jgi:deoxyribodipyrimidine photolyase-related protein
MINKSIFFIILLYLFYCKKDIIEDIIEDIFNTMKECVIILPTQLFEDNFILKHQNQKNKQKVFLYEHPVYFTKYKFHKLKLILHRATMKRYLRFLADNSVKTEYLEFDYDVSAIFEKYNKITMFDPIDQDITAEFNNYADENDTNLIFVESPMFLTKPAEFRKNFNNFHQTPFYIWQRKRLNILVDDDKPVGGKWTFDSENRVPYSGDNHIDFSIIVNNDIYVNEATKYVSRYFPDNIGDNEFYLPIDFEGAKAHLREFLKVRLRDFGKYQDAVSDDVIVGNHSMLSPFLNIGLLTPEYVIGEILKIYYKKDKNSKKDKKDNKAPLASVEAIIRQIIGWRELVRLMYHFNHEMMITTNHFNHNHKLGDEWYPARSHSKTLNIAPIDHMINKAKKYAYLHHIERLMYVGNFMLLCEINPREVYDWFMIMFIDSYAWVMEANVYAMSQYSTGGVMMTRPYFSSSNYINKMSSATFRDKKDDWQEIWNALYYNFINVNKTELAKNYATASSVAHFNKKSKEEQQELLKIAKDYLKKY